MIVSLLREQIRERFPSKPTHALTLVLCIGRKIEDRWVRLVREHAEQTYQSFIRSRSKRLTKPNTWKRYKREIASFGGIECGGAENRPHLHLSLYRPSGIRNVEFVARVHECAAENPWIMSGEYAVKLDSLENAPGADIERWVEYSLKDYSLDKGGFICSGKNNC